MKKFAFLLTLLIYAIANSACAQTEMIENITFKSNTRGGQRLIEVSKSSIAFTNNGSTETSELSTSEWDSILTTLSEIKLQNLENLNPPSDGRARDAAWHSTIIIITTDGNEYSTTSFDNAKAPAELEDLMKILVKLDKELNENNQVLDY